MMANPFWNNNDPLENRIRQTVREWESSPPSDWDTPPQALWQKIAPAVPPAPPAHETLSWLWKWIAGGAVLAAAVAIAVYFSNPSTVKQITTPEYTTNPAAADATSPGAVASQPSAPATDSGAEAFSKPYEAGGTQKDHPVFQPKPLSLPRQITQAMAPAYLAAPPGFDPGYAYPTAAGAPPTVEEIQPLVTGMETQEGKHSAENMPAAAGATGQTEKRSIAPGIIADADVQQPEYSPAKDEGEHVAYMEPVQPLTAHALLLPVFNAAAEDALLPASGFARRARHTGRFFAGVVMAPNQTFRRIQSSRPTGQLPAFLRENEFAAWTTEWGVRAGWKPSRRVAFSTGLGLYSMGQQSLHRFRIAYDPGRERPAGNDNVQGTYNLTVPSAYGDARVEVNVQRPVNQAIPAGQAMVVEMRTSLRIRYITLPLNACYFPVSGRFSAGIKAGVALNFLQEERLNAATRIVTRGLASRIIAVQRGTERTERMVPDYQIGAALWYRPLPGWLLSVEPSFRQSIGPVIERELFNVSQYAWGVQVGVQRFF